MIRRPSTPQIAGTLAAIALTGCITGTWFIHKIDHTVIAGSTAARFGYTLQGGFNMNDDFVADLAVGGPVVDSVYLYTADDLAAGGGLDTTDAVKFTGEPGGEAGWAMAAGHLFGNDLHSELVIAAPSEEGGRGRIYVLAGGGLTKKLDQQVVSTLVGSFPGEYAGWAVTVGNFNGDGHQDLMVGACGANSNKGKVYLVYGPLPAGESSLGDADAILTTTLHEARMGCAVTAIDLNGDGRDEPIIGAYQTTDFEKGTALAAGGVYVLWDTPNGLLDIDEDIPGISLLTAPDQSQTAGFALSGRGDANGDGIQDLIVGAPSRFCAHNDAHGEPAVACNERPDARAYLILGDDKLEQSLPRHGLLGDVAVATVSGASLNDGLGTSVAFAGDVNQDGFDEALLGTNSTHQTYLFYGGSTDDLEVGDIDADEASATFDGSVQGLFLGQNVAWIGDVNQDGNADMVMSGSGQEWYEDGPQLTKGQVHLVLGEE